MVQDLDRREGGGPDPKQKEQKTFRNPLPAGSRECCLGPAKTWSPTLQAFSLTLSTFPYPAAVFYQEELVILHNQAWADLAGIDQQGQKQRGELSADAWETLTAALHGGKPRKILAGELLRTKATSVIIPSTYSSVLLSPLFAIEGEEVVGLLAQLIPQESNEASPPNDHQLSPDASKDNGLPAANVLDISKLGSVMDEPPLDQHPFFHRFAEMLPTGLAILDHEAKAVFVNQVFYQLTTHHDDNKTFKSWPQSIHPEDFGRVMDAYQDAFKSQKRLRTEFRAMSESNPWRLLLLTPLGDENLRHVSLREYGGFVCSVVDISSEKSAELSERKAAKEARERREQQERFIDMISHEIRNPLSAILHSTEDVAEEVQKPKPDIDVDAIHEALETIELCISQQRSIVDDVLSFSKLDSGMLSLDPKSCQPTAKISTTLKMFQREFRKQSMEYSFCIDTSYPECFIDFVLADMARIGQVLVNLVSNAIKFMTKVEGERNVTVSIGASLERPTSYPPNVVYFASDDKARHMDATMTAPWGDGEAVYILVAVKDSGIGISEEGQKQLFERFHQATPKTAGLYGGSGLGLNISRKLCHLHGGEIGVSSTKGSGSTFGFFFRVKRVTGSERNARTQADDDATDAEDLKAHVRALGNVTGTTADDEAKAPVSVRDPPVMDSMPRPEGSEESRDGKGINLASREKESTANEHANPHRPGLAQQRSSEMRYAEAFDEYNAEESANPSEGAPISTLSQHVLLVEDNLVNQRIVHRKLQTKGFQVTVANNGREAIEVVRKSPPPSSGDKGSFAIILMDQEMPILDGNSATKEIRSLEEDGTIEHIPILGISANVRGAQLQDMLDSGMDGVLSKPYKMEDLVEKIAKLTTRPSDD